MSKSLTYVEIDIPAFTQNSPPDSPVLIHTYRFTTDVSYLPNDIDAIPSIIEVRISPSIVSLGGDLGQRASVDISFKDHKHIFDGESYDSGTFWGKFRARYGLKLRGFPLRIICGVLGDALVSMETRHFVIESTDGPTTNGQFRIVAKDVLKFADGDRAQAPRLSPGFLLADITNVAGTLTLSPTGAGDSYGPSGLVAISGSEIVSYTRLGYDAYDVLLIHADSSSPDVITDVLDTPHTITRVGSINASNAQSKFGGSSVACNGGYLQLDGSSEFAFGTGDFTIEFFFRRNSTGATHTLYDSRPTGTNGFYITITVSAGNALTFITNNNGQIASGGVVGANTWYHCALARKSGITKMFLDGVQVGSDYIDPNSYLNPASRPDIGADGITPGGNSLSGFMDEIKVSKGIARYVQAFTPPTAAYSATGSGDVLTIVRGLYNTVANTHKISDRVQLCLEYLGKDVADIIYDLLITYALIDPSFITLANWKTETATYLSNVYSALIAEPTSVKDLIDELIEQASLVVWWDDINQQIRLQVLRNISTTSDIFDQTNMMSGSLQVSEQPEKRISQVYTYFNKINPLIKGDQIDNYGSSAYAADLVSEAAYGSANIKKIFSRWIPAGGRSVADGLNSILLARFVTPPRRINFDVMRYSDEAPALGLGYQIKGWPFQLITGAADTVPAQVIRLNPRADLFEVEVEEVFAGAGAAPNSPNDHVILIDSNIQSVNLRTMHDSLFSAPVSGVNVFCTILSGVLVGSNSTGTPAFDVGTWPAGVTISLTVIGRIEGAGGNGGAGTTTVGNPGLPGGTALYTRQAISLTDTSGAIWGGGGGGGAGGGGHGTGGQGGGGAGQTPGSGANAGTTTTGGAGGLPVGGFAAPAGNGGTGGGPGLSGVSGRNDAFAAGAGGASGSAIDGVSLITTIGGAGDRRGGQVN